MAKKISIIRGADYNTQTFPTAAAAGIEAGDVVKLLSNKAARITTGEPEIGTDIMLGIASAPSTDTASVAGTVEVAILNPGKTVLRGEATTPANLDGATEIGKSVTFDVSGDDFTVDEDEATDDAVHSLRIIGSDVDDGTVDFVVRPAALM